MIHVDFRTNRRLQKRTSVWKEGFTGAPHIDFGHDPSAGIAITAVVHIENEEGGWKTTLRDSEGLLRRQGRNENDNDRARNLILNYPSDYDPLESY